MKTLALFLLVALLAPLRAAEPKTTREFVFGTVLQKNEHGLIINADAPLARQYDVELENGTATIDAQHEWIPAKAVHTIFLVDYPGFETAVDDQTIRAIITRIGNYKYKTVLGAEKTVAAYKFVQSASNR